MVRCCGTESGGGVPFYAPCPRRPDLWVDLKNKKNSDKSFSPVWPVTKDHQGVGFVGGTFLLDFLIFYFCLRKLTKNANKPRVKDIAERRRAPQRVGTLIKLTLQDVLLLSPPR